MQSPKDVYDSLTPKLQNLVQSYPSLIKIGVHWGEQDIFQHVNNAVYARYAESSRIAFYVQIVRPNVSAKFFENFIGGKTLGNLVRTLTINYHSPVVFPDDIVMASKMHNFQYDRYVHSFVAVSVSQERIVASGSCLMVMFDFANMTKCKVPDELRAAMEQKEDNHESKL